MPKGQQLNLQQTLAFVCIFYCTYSAGKACLFPFLTLYLRQLGLSSAQTGIIFGLKALVSLWAAPLWSDCAVRYKRQRIVLLGAVFMMIASNLGLTLLPPADEKLYFSFCYPYNTSVKESPEPTNIFLGNTNTTVSYFTPVTHSTTSTHERLSSNPPMTTAYSATSSQHMSTSIVDKPLDSSPKPTKEYINPATYSVPKSHKSKIHTSTNIPRKQRLRPDHSQSQQATDAGPANLESSLESSSYLDSLIQLEWNNSSLASPQENKRIKTKGDAIKLDSIPRGESTLSDKQLVTKSGPAVKNKKNGKIRNRRVPTEMMSDNIDQNDNLPRSLVLNSPSEDLSDFWELEKITFVIALLIVVIGESLACPVDKICDSSLHETLDSADELDKYNRHRVPSIISFSLAAVVVTLIIDNTSCQIFLQASRFMIHFYLFAVLLGLTFLLAFFYPIPATKKTNRHPRFCKGLRLLFADPHNTMVTLTAVIAGALISNVHNFLFWQIQDLGGSDVIMGVSVLVSTGSHIPVLFLLNWIMRKLTQPGVFVLAMLCLAVQLIYFAFLWTPWAVIPLQVLSAFSQRGLWESVMSYSEQISPPAMDRSVQSILNSLHHGLGFAIGSIIGGFVYDHAGLKVLYGASGGVALLWAIVIIMVTRFVPKKKKLHYTSLLHREEEEKRNEGYASDDDSDEEYGNDWLIKAMHNEF